VSPFIRTPIRSTTYWSTSMLTWTFPVRTGWAWACGFLAWS